MSDDFHVWHTYDERDGTVCTRCGIMRRADGRNKPCPWRTPHIETRDDRELQHWLADGKAPAAAGMAISARPTTGTVGELLATAPVGAIVEFWHGATANQITTRVGGIDRVWLWRYRNPNGEWSPWDYEPPSPDDLAQVGAIVPVDPSTRGPIGEG